MAYQPVLYLFMFSASVRLAINKTEPPKFDTVITDNFYVIWLLIGIFSPLMALASWIFIEKLSGRAVFMGMWMRLASDIGMLTVLLSYHLVTIKDGRIEATVFSRYLMGSTMLFVVTLIIRDLWTIYIMEKLAAQIHSEELDE